MGQADALHLDSAEVDYPHVEAILKEKLWRIYSGNHPYDRLKALSQWLEEGLSLASAVALATAKDFEAAKEFYDEFIQAGLSQVTAYVLASSAHPYGAFAHYQELIAAGVNESQAYVQAVSKNHSSDSGLEELQARVRRFLSGLEEQAPKGRTSIVIGQSLQDEDRRFRALAGLEEYGVFLHRKGEGADLITHLIGTGDTRYFQLAGLEEEATELQPFAQRAGMKFDVIQPSGDFAQQMLSLLSRKTGLEEPTLRTQGFKEFLADLAELSSA